MNKLGLVLMILIFLPACSKYKAVQEKLAILKVSYIENQILSEENERLRLENNRLKFQISEMETRNYLSDFAEKNLKQTGSRSGRTLSSVNYEIPLSSKVDDLFNVGMEFLKTDEFDKAAKIFYYLSTKESYVNRKNVFYPLGISFFNLNNYFEAINAFSKVDDKELKPKILIWEALIYKNLGDKIKYKDITDELALMYGNTQEAYFLGSYLIENKEHR